jgi:hypothetical protein
MGCCELSRHRMASIFLCFWAGVGGIVAIVAFILNDEKTCVELRQVMMVTGIGLCAFSFLYFCNNFFLENGFPYLLLSTLYFVALVDVIMIYIIYASGNETALVSQDCGDDDRTLPWFMISWLSPFVLIFIILTCYILTKSDSFYSKTQTATKTTGERQTLLLDSKGELQTLLL